MRNILQLISSSKLKALAPKIYEAWESVDISLDELSKRINDLILPKIIYCRATNNIDTAIGIAAWTAIPFNITRFQNSNIHDNTTNNTNFNISKEGFYTFGASISVDGSGAATNFHKIALTLTRNAAATQIAISSQTDPTIGIGAPTSELTLTTGYYLYPKDVLKVEVYSNVAFTALGNLTYSPEFWIMNYSRDHKLDA